MEIERHDEVTLAVCLADLWALEAGREPFVCITLASLLTGTLRATNYDSGRCCSNLGGLIQCVVYYWRLDS